MVELAGGLFPMGSTGESAYPADGEGPVHDVELSPFRIESFTVTNAQFAEFVDGHRIRHRGATLRMVVRVRRLASR